MNEVIEKDHFLDFLTSQRLSSLHTEAACSELWSLIGASEGEYRDTITSNSRTAVLLLTSKQDELLCGIALPFLSNAITAVANVKRNVHNNSNNNRFTTYVRSTPPPTTTATCSTNICKSSCSIDINRYQMDVV